PVPDRDPLIYVLGACNDIKRGGCRVAMDACGRGGGEHLTFTTPADAVPQDYIIGIDSKESGGAAYGLEVYHPVCGNAGNTGVREHSEGCDDGDTISGDGCDSQCRR